MNLEEIRAILMPHLKGKTVSDDTPLVSGGLIDSMTIVDLIVDLSDRFDVEIPASEVTPEDFDSVRKILATLTRFR
jgi:D-alanine--poly(phosphoribitol) ligase subunit 2